MPPSKKRHTFAENSFSNSDGANGTENTFKSSSSMTAQLAPSTIRDKPGALSSDPHTMSSDSSSGLHPGSRNRSLGLC
ncbi:hypothetical protein VTN49DRAFT_5165 [Thermomyces lanuginosus]|uniref:uncharacterized protein n=1 Tax=Thermomyces lanuginosus TaxID=5541 RepID=UPI003742CA33